VWHFRLEFHYRHRHRQLRHCHQGHLGCHLGLIRHIRHQVQWPLQMSYCHLVRQGFVLLIQDWDFLLVPRQHRQHQLQLDNLFLE
jgi:hypothetical protein